MIEIKDTSMKFINFEIKITMKKPYTILLPVDYSKSSEYVERYALKLCDMLPAELAVVHVYSINYPDPTNPLGYAVDLTKLYNTELEHLNNHVKEMVDKYGYSDKDIRIKTEVVEGTVAASIATYAESNKIDLIVAGTHEKRELREYIFGTHTLELIRMAKVPVLAIPEGAVYQAWKNIVLTTAFRDGELSVARYTEKLSEKFGAQFEILHLEASGDDKWEDQLMADDFKEKLTKTIKDKNIRINMKGPSEDLVADIKAHCKENQTDLLVISPSKTYFLERLFGQHLSPGLLMHTEIPLLCVPDAYGENEDVYLGFLDENL